MPEQSPELFEFTAEMVRGGLRQSTIDKRLSVLLRAEKAAGHPLIECTSTELRDWLDGHKLHARTRYSYISHFSAFWTWALTEERATKNPTLRLTRPKLRQGLPRPVATTDLTILVSQAPDASMRAMIVLAGYAGLRCMEIAGLDASDVMEHFKPPSIVIANGKGGKPRIVPVGQPIIEALRAHGVPPYGPVFRDEDGQPLQPWKVSHIMREHMHACGINASAHQLRHAFGTEVYRQSRDLRMTQELMGHASPTTTAGYTAWAADEAAAIVNKLFT